MEYYNYPQTNVFGFICHYDNDFDSNEQIPFIPSPIYENDDNSINKNNFFDNNDPFSNFDHISEVSHTNDFNYNDDDINSNHDKSYNKSPVKDVSCNKGLETANDISKKTTKEKTIASDNIKNDAIFPNRIVKDNESSINLLVDRFINQLTNKKPKLAINNIQRNNNISIEKYIINKNAIINEGIINNNQVVNEGEMINNIVSRNNDNSNSSKTDEKPKKRKFKSTKDMGRKTKGHSIPGNNGKKSRNKFSPDNMRLKFKRAFTKSLIDFINFKMKQNPKLKKKGKLKKLSDKIIKSNNKQALLDWMNAPAKSYLSNDISKQWKTKDVKFNKRLIQQIFDAQDKDIMYILNKKIIEIMKIFRGEIDDEIFNDFKRLQYFIDNKLIIKNPEDVEYIKVFANQVTNFEKEVDNLIPKKKK